jgi:hypothetical protein
MLWARTSVMFRCFSGTATRSGAWFLVEKMQLHQHLELPFQQLLLNVDLLVQWGSQLESQAPTVKVSVKR